MNLDNIVRVGFRPWLPSPEAHNLDAWHADGVPTVGTVHVGDLALLFSAIDEVSPKTMVWAYPPLTASEEDKLAILTFPDEATMGEHVAHMFEGRDTVYALAEDHKITRWGCTESPAAGLIEGATAFLQQVTLQLQAELRHVEDAAETLVTAGH